MTKKYSLGQWLRFLSAAAPTSARWQTPAARAAQRRLATFAKVRLLASLGALSSKPFTVTDDGVVRVVTAMNSIRYGYNRRDRTFFAVLREEGGGWRFVPESDPNVVIFDTFLPHRAWRRRICYTLRAELRETLRGLMEGVVDDFTDDHRGRLLALIEDTVERAWRGLGMRKRLIARFQTKDVRRHIRELLHVDPRVLALGRAARFRGRHKAIEQKWLSFIWQHQETLERIRMQTPGLLRPVAQHMHQFGVRAGRDPTRECLKWLVYRGVSKRSYLLLARVSDRPFREVLERFPVHQALEALALSLSLSERGHDARVPRPSFLRATFDQFGASMDVIKIRERLAVVPTRVFIEAQERMAESMDRDVLREVALDYRGIVDWWVACQPSEHANASWSRWRQLAEEAEARHRASIDPATWPCAIEELRTPEAEVLALSTPLALFEEGRALRHCAYSYAGKCEADQVRLFAARMHHQGRTERATIGLRREPRGWRIWDIRGPCNRRMGGHWIPLARQVAETYTRNSGAAQLALPIACILGDELRERQH